MEGLDELNVGLKRKGLRMTVEAKNNLLWLRGTFPDKETGIRRRQRLPLELKAVEANLVSAESRALQFHDLLSTGRWPAEDLPWSRRTAIQPPLQRQEILNVSPLLSCGQAAEQLRRDFWAGKARTSAAERSWSRLADELKRLPANAELTLPLLKATIEARTVPGSRSRLEATKTFLRLGRLVGLDDIESLARLKGQYVPKERELPTDEQLLEFLLAMRPLKWGWATAACAVFGCRPAEVPSLQIHDDGTATVISVKTKNRKPTLRTCFALPRSWIEELSLDQIDLPGGVRWSDPDDYDSDTSRRWVESWRHGLRAADARAAVELLGTAFTSYDLRHCWAVRSIRSGLPMTLCAKALGHSVQVHEQQYHRWLTADALRSAMAQLQL